MGAGLQVKTGVNAMHSESVAEVRLTQRIAVQVVAEINRIGTRQSAKLLKCMEEVVTGQVLPKSEKMVEGAQGYAAFPLTVAIRIAEALGLPIARELLGDAAE